MKFESKFNVGAVFKLTIRKANTHEVVSESPEFTNLVLDTGLTRMTIDTWINRCCVGSGNSTPIPSQVALDNFIASTTQIATGSVDSGGVNLAAEPYYWFSRRTWRFDTGVATGNLSEIGLGWGNSNLWNRALIRDNSGNPTTVTVLADEYLDVLCEIRVYPSSSTGNVNLVDKLGNIVSTHSYIVRPFFAYDQSTQTGAGNFFTKISFGVQGVYAHGVRISPNALPAGNTSFTGTFKNAVNTYGVNNTTATIQLSGTEFNFLHKSIQIHIDGLACRTLLSNTTILGCAYQIELTPAIDKNTSKIITYNFTLNWGRYTL